MQVPPLWQTLAVQDSSPNEDASNCEEVSTSTSEPIVTLSSVETPLSTSSVISEVSSDGSSVVMAEKQANVDFCGNGVICDI